jgi:predicted CoA-binding protein
MTPVAPIAPAARIPHILNHSRTIAVVGLSHKPHRASFDVARYMQAVGYRIIPINPNEAEVLGEKAYASLTDAAAHETFEMVNCFRNSEDIPPIVDEVIALRAGPTGSRIASVWMQLGIAHAESAAKAEAAGLLVVQDRCLKIDHRVLLTSGAVQSRA